MSCSPGRRRTTTPSTGSTRSTPPVFHGFPSGFRGVSTKRLDEYLAWFLWRRAYAQDREDIAVRQVNVTSCDDTVCDWAHMMPPYMDYWGATA